MLGKFLRVSLLAAATVATTGAHAQTGPSIGAIIYARDSQFWQQIERGMRDAAKALSADIQFGVNRRQLATESQVVEDFVTRGVDVLIMPPLDRQASQASARRARERNIMVVEYDTRLDDQGIASHTIGVDSRELAGAVGKEMRAFVEAKAASDVPIGMVTLSHTNPNMVPRKEGFLAAMQGYKYTLVAEVAGSTPEEGANGFENILRRNPETAAVWCSNAGTTAGAAAAARRAGTKARLFGIDMSQELAEMLLDPASSVEAVSDQQPYRVGYLAVETAVKAKRGEIQPRQVQVPVKLYSKANPGPVREYLDLVKSLSN